MAAQIFLNLPVRDLNRSIEFFTKLGFSFNEEFTDENATCMVIGENIFVMLLADIFFKTFTDKKICDTSTHQEALISITADSRSKVDELLQKVEGAGGSENRPAQDHGWMYGRSFTDPDGHHWEIFFMDTPDIQVNE